MNFWTGLLLGLNCSLCLVPFTILLIAIPFGKRNSDNS